MKLSFRGKYVLWCFLFLLSVGTKGEAESFFLLDLGVGVKLQDTLTVDVFEGEKKLNTVTFVAGGNLEKKLPFEVNPTRTYRIHVIAPAGNGSQVYFSTGSSKTFFLKKDESSNPPGRLKADKSVLSLRPDRVIGQAIALNQGSRQKSVYAYALLSQYGSWSELLKEANEDEAENLVVTAINGFERNSQVIYGRARAETDGILYKRNVDQMKQELNTILDTPSLREKVSDRIPLIRQQLKALDGEHQVNIKALLVNE